MLNIPVTVMDIQLKNKHQLLNKSLTQLKAFRAFAPRSFLKNDEWTTAPYDVLKNTTQQKHKDMIERLHILNQELSKDANFSQCKELRFWILIHA